MFSNKDPEPKPLKRSVADLIISFDHTLITKVREKSKYGVFSDPHFSPNVGKYEPEKTPYLDTFYAVQTVSVSGKYLNCAPQLISLDVSEINVIYM